MARLPTPATLRWLALFSMLPLMGLGVVVVTVPEAQTVISSGPIQHGHADVDCAGCHVASAGTVRQQTQANVKFAMGLREHPVDFGFQEVDAQTCIGCHERPNDRHPIYRFNEPRFRDAKATVDATTCLGCHTEHTGQKAFVEPTFCVACHQDLTLKNDPIDVPHVTLIAEKQWGTCLGCHDFHGNHPVKPQVTLAAAYDEAAILDYLAEGPSPYGEDKIYEAKTE